VDEVQSQKHIVVYHVCSLKKLIKYLSHGKILPPVRAWLGIQDAERFSKQTGRQIIIRLKFRAYKPLDGHKGQAVYMDEPYDIKKWFGISKGIGSDTESEVE